MSGEGGAVDSRKTKCPEEAPGGTDEDKKGLYHDKRVWSSTVLRKAHPFLSAARRNAGRDPSRKIQRPGGTMPPIRRDRATRGGGWGGAFLHRWPASKKGVISPSQEKKEGRAPRYTPIARGCFNSVSK